MVESKASGLKLTLRYRKGSYSYSRLDPAASDSQLREVAGAINSLQREGAGAVCKTEARRIVEAG